MKRLMFMAMIVAMIVWSACILHAGIIKGRVLSSEDESIITGAKVTVYEDSVKVSEISTDNKGAFSIEIVDGGKEYRLEIRQPGYDTSVLSARNPWGTVDLGRILLTPEATMLNDVEVTVASKVIYLPDKRIIFPSQLEKDRSVNPLNLLAQISYSDPSLDIDEFHKSISVNGMTPQILINGVKKSYSDFNVINPRNVLKIEYVTSPDVRYGVPYVNIVTVKPPQGGSVMAEVSAPVTTRQENHQAYSSYRRGKHEVAVNYNGTFRDSRKEYCDLTEQYFAPDKTYEFIFKGQPSRLLDRDHGGSVEYSLIESPKKMLVATAALSYHSNDRDNRQMCETPSESFRRLTRNYNKDLSPSLQLYGSLPVTDDGRIEMNLTGAYNSGDYNRRMAQTNGYDETTVTKSDAYTIGAEIYYEHRLSWSRFNIGLSQNFTGASNIYDIGGASATDRLHSANTMISASLGGQAGRILGYFVSAGLKHHRVERGYTSPYFYLSLQKDVRDVHLQYQASFSSSSGSLSQYSDILLPVNEILYRTGNMALKNTNGGGNNINATYTHNNFSALAVASYYAWYNVNITLWDYVDDPSSPIYGKFIQTYHNDGSRYAVFGTGLILRLSNLFNHLSLSGSVLYRDARSRWQEHEWGKKWATVSGAARAYFGDWQFGTTVALIPDYTMSGNFLWRNFPWWGISGSWKKGNLSVSCEISDLFSKKAYYQEKTTMAIGGISESSSWIADKNNWIAFTLRYQLSFGQQPYKPQRNVSGDTRVDTGVKL